MLEPAAVADALRTCLEMVGVPLTGRNVPSSWSSWPTR
jgi:hypothetical protein